MNAGTSGKKSQELDALDFEFIDMNSARQELDQLPPGINERKNLDPSYWATHRRPPAAADRALTGAAIDWIMALPPAMRPNRLCELYPRVANTIADVWSDLPRTAVMIDRLLHDDRGGTRRGFPEDVRKDLAVLLRHATLLQQRD